MNYILNALAGASFIAMVILTCWQVFTRYILKHPSSWSEELVSYLFAWMALLGASVVVGERGHMNISIAVERMGAGAQNAFAVFAECIALPVCRSHPALWRRADHQPGHGTDDLVPGGTRGHFLCGASVWRECGEYFVYTLLNIADILRGRAAEEREG